MKDNIKNKLILFFAYTLIVFAALTAAFKANDMSLLNSDNSLLISNEEFEPNLSMHKIDKFEQGMQEYVFKLSREELDHLRTDTLVFFLNKLTDNAYSVKLNDIVIGFEGDMGKGHSMFKNSPNHFSFDKKLIQDENTLTINTYATYKSGLETKGVYITDSKVGMEQARKIDFFGIHIIILSIGFLMFSIVAMVVIYYINKNKEIGFLYSAIATVFIAIYFIDYLKIVHLPYSYLTYKKIFMISLYIAVWFYMLAMSKFLDCFYLKYLAAFNTISFIVMSLLVNDFILYKKLYSYWYLALLVNIILGFICSLKNLKKVRQAFIFLAAFLYSSIYASLAILIEFFNSSFSINSPLVYIVIFSALPLLFGFEELTSKEKQISHEKQLKEREYINALTDNLSGAWNQRFLYSELYEKMGQSVIAMCDIDDFKVINDNYSHLAGDHVIKEFSDLVKRSIRKTDYLCRYGGDEFIILFYNCDVDQVSMIMEEIRRKVERHKFIYKGQIMKITISIGIYKTKKDESVDQALEMVDKELYLSKQNGKNCISIHRD